MEEVISLASESNYLLFSHKIVQPRGDLLVHYIVPLMSGSQLKLKASYGFRTSKIYCDTTRIKDIS